MVPGSAVCTSPARCGRKQATRSTGCASAAMARHAETAAAGAENGMILTVASICPGRTTANSGNVAMVIASSSAFTRWIRAASMIARPATPACRLARPVVDGATDTPLPARL